MAAHPMSFADVLQDEYRYFFNEVPLQNTIVEISEAHVRELPDFANKLLLARTQKVKSRWKLLGQRAFDGGIPENPGAAVIKALNAMLADPLLLHTLIETDESVAREVGEPAALHALLAVPIARRLVLQEKALHDTIRKDDGVVPRFATTSAAIRVLQHEGAQDVLLKYPALLSTIADDPRVEEALLASVSTRQTLRKFFTPLPRLAWYSPLRWFGGRSSAERKDDIAMHDVAGEAAKLLLMIGHSDSMPESQPIPAAARSRFNALILEIVYGDYVSDGVTMREIYRAIHRQETSAICLSGGGIRSATFNLGILQGLADHRMLNRFNYISTVSGGGYIGSWLSSWIRRHNAGAVGVAEDLVREAVDPLAPEVKPITHLREYSSYLAPQSSAFSVDTWTLLATYVRNLLLNWTMLLPAMAAVLALPRVMAMVIGASVSYDARWPGVVATLAAFFAVVMVGVVRPKSDVTAKKRTAAAEPMSEQYNRYRLWLYPLLASGVCFSIYWAAPTNMFRANEWLLPALFVAGGLVAAFVHVMRRAAAMTKTSGATTRFGRLRATFKALRHWKQQGRRLAFECGAAALAGLIGGWLLYTIFDTVFPPSRELGSTLWFEAYVCTALPLYLLVFFLEATLMVGLTTKSSSDHDREWWARSAATMFLAGTGVAALSIVAIVLPLLILQLPEFLAPVGGLSGAASWLLKKKLTTAKPKSERSTMPLMTMLHIAAAITMAFVLALVSIASSYVLLQWMQVPAQSILTTIFGRNVTEATAVFLNVLRLSPAAFLVAFLAGATAIAFAMSWVLDVNLYSMHAMYRNRLVRAYLGASRWTRNPDAFTGFDPQDDVRMADLRPEALWPSCIVNFDAFLGGLKANTNLLGQLPADVQNRIRAYVISATGEDRESLKAAVVAAINELLPVRDLEHNVPAPPSLDMYLKNRDYLDQCLAGSLKRFDVGVRLSGGVDNAPPTLAVDDDDDAVTRRIKAELSSTKQVRFESPNVVSAKPPLHIVNAALNLVGGSNLAWQERKAATFTISPLHSGSRLLRYRDSAVYAGGVTLGTALAISGAAVSPNMGSLSSPTFTFLMTLFNARLGWWLGNPAKDKYESISPRESISSLMREAGGKTDASHPYVFLSDGGHFENLGIYEMVARRCKYILVCDASADGEYAFSDLANAVRKIRIDMGIPIEPLKTEYVRPEAGEKHGKYCAMGEIQYGNVDGCLFGCTIKCSHDKPLGYLLYIKPALREDCPADVRNYGRESRSFPHESTVDQFFSESQFESYRALGRHILGQICETGSHKAPWVAPNVAAFFGKAYAYINKLEPGIGNRPVQSMKDVVSWMRDGL